MSPDALSPPTLHGILRSTLHLVEYYMDKGTDVPAALHLTDVLRTVIRELESTYKFEPLSDFDAIRRETDSKWFHSQDATHTNPR